jgi:hypothetical protein
MHVEGAYRYRRLGNASFYASTRIMTYMQQRIIDIQASRGHREDMVETLGYERMGW